MKGKKHFISLKTKIIIATIIPVFFSFALISSLIFLSLINSLQETAEAKFLQISQKYAYSFESKIDSAMNYLSILASELEVRAEGDVTDRETLQKSVMKIFDNYQLLDGSSVYFEPNMYDGKDAQYMGTQYGTAASGRICWYFYRNNGQTAYLPEAMENDIEFSLPHYIMAKEANKPIYTDPVAYEIEGKSIPMFTLTYPVKNTRGEFAGAVTVDLFLDDIYAQLQEEQIYDTGYVIIANDNGRIIYCPHYDDIGKTREEAGLVYPLPSVGESSVFFNAQSAVNGKDTLITIGSVYIAQLDRYFYISVAAPLNEINASGARLMIVLIIFSMFIVAAIALLIYYLIGKISAPLNEISESVDKIAGGDYHARITGAYKGEFAVVKDSVNSMADSIEAYIEESESSLDVLKNILSGLDAVIYVTDPATDEMLFVNDSMMRLFALEDDGAGRKCWQVLKYDVEERCDFCPCYQLDKAPNQPYVWEEYNDVTKRYYRNTDRYIDWLGGKKAHLQHAVDITDIKMAAFALDRRLEQQALMTFISQSFLSGADMDMLISSALRMIGEFMGVAQVLFYELADDGVTFNCKDEWINPALGLQTHVGTKLVLQEPFLSIVMGLSAEREFCLSSNDPDMKKAMLPYRTNFVNYITTPVFLKGKMCAALDFSREDDGREWSESDINLAALVASLLSGVFERRSMEGQLRRLSSIVESSPQFIFYITAEGKVDYVNPAALTITGYTEAELIEGGLDIIFDQSTVREIREKYIPDTLKNGIGNFEIDLIRKDGRRRIMAFSSFTTGPDSANVGGIASDVTEIRQLEAELIAAKELAEQGSRSKSEFLSRMSHEMRTPMNAIIGMTSIAQSSDDPAKKEYCLERIDNASRHLLGVINDILDMSKIEANKFELSYAEFSFERMLHNVVNVINFRVEEKHQALTLNLDPSMPTALIGDEQRLAQVITNLLTNAAKFTPEYGMIQLKAGALGEQNGVYTLQIEIIDSGIGISDEQQQRLFHSFEQADGSIARKFGGTGLGLAISKRIVELMGGRIWVESALGQGSKFIFTLQAEKGQAPLPDSSPRLASVEEADTVEDGGKTPQTFAGKTALLAEDVDINREIILTVLEDTRLQIDCAENGRQAIEIFAAAPQKYDIIFMDVHMPEIDGLEATRRIRELPAPEGARVPIVAMTANVFQEDVQKCLAAGMNDHIGKPIDFEELFAKLRKYLR